MENQTSIFDFLEVEEEKPKADICEGCIFFRDKCMYTKESRTDFCIEGSKKLGVGDHVFSVDAGKITNQMIIDAKGSSANYFKCTDKKGQITEINILSIREWWNVTYEQAKKSKFFEERPRKESNPEKPICKYSNHSCNKEVLHALAKESDPFCPSVCCRFCNTEYCGVRCNGSEEPKEPKKAAEHVEQKQDIVLLPDFAKGKGWISVETIPKNLKWHIDVLGTYKYNNKECWSQCKGYYNSKDNQYVALDYPIDIPRAEWKFWRYRNSCINCTRYVKGTEQPPAGWGEVGWCNQHKQKVSSAEIGYCQKHERVDFYDQ